MWLCCIVCEFGVFTYQLLGRKREVRVFLVCVFWSFQRSFQSPLCRASQIRVAECLRSTAPVGNHLIARHLGSTDGGALQALPLGGVYKAYFNQAIPLPAPHLMWYMVSGVGEVDVPCPKWIHGSNRLSGQIRPRGQRIPIPALEKWHLSKIHSYLWEWA